MSPTLIGYAYEADVHCVTCSLKSGQTHLALNSSPIFDIDEDNLLSHCGDCEEPLNGWCEACEYGTPHVVLPELNDTYWAGDVEWTWTEKGWRESTE